MIAQTRPADQIIVVDDGSWDNPERIAARFEGVEFIRQENGGLSAARNTGLLHARHEAILFLDADDLLAPEALERSAACLAGNPGAAFVYGAHRRVDRQGKPLGPVSFAPTGADAYADLLRGNWIAMHGTVLYDRATLELAGGFDTSFRKCEDYDVYLRLAREHAIAHHPELVADYRIHGENMSGDSRSMLDWVRRVRARHSAARTKSIGLERAWRQGDANWRQYYVEEMLDRSRYGADAAKRRKAYLDAFRTSPRTTGGIMLTRLRKRVAARLPATIKHRAKRLLGRPSRPPLGHVRMGDLDHVRPISVDFGYDRGNPVDRYYIESFLRTHASDIRGRVLEIGDAAYCEEFGTGITQQDVLHIDPEAEGATLVGDLSQAGILPDDAFDCLVITQTLHLIYDMPAAVDRLRASLKPGGVLLLTVPGISPVDHGEWGGTWYWSLTDRSAERLFGEAFGAENIAVEAHGNAYAATCFVQGMALEEVRRNWLDQTDTCYPVVVTVRAVRAR